MRRTRKIALSARGVYEPVLLEEDVLGQCRSFLELNGARVSRVAERIPKRDVYGRIKGRVSERGILDTFGWWPKGRNMLLRIDDNFDVQPWIPRVIPSSPKMFGGWRYFKILQPIHFLFELKRPGEKPNEAQTVTLNESTQDGVLSLWADSLEMMLQKFAEKGIGFPGDTKLR